MNTKQFLALLKSKREVFAYVVIDSDFGVYVKQSKAAWIEKVSGSAVEHWNVTTDGQRIVIG